MFEKKRIGEVDTPNSNLFRINPSKSYKLKNRLKLKKSKLYNFFIGILILFLIIFTIRFFFLSINFSIFSISKGFIDKLVSIEEDENGFVNILLIGAGGGDHDGALLTDTMMVVSADLKNKSVTILSIPRDFYVNYNPIYHGSRINEIYRDMSKRMENLGIDKTIASNEARGVLIKTISNILDLKISYFAQIDFKGFIEIVDTIGGIEIYNKQKILDETYPDGEWGYEIFELDKGFHALSGVTALKYARSRHSSSDFDRAARQQQIINAIREKVFTANIITNPSRIKNLYNTASKYYKTNLGLSQILSLAYSFKDFPKENVYNAVLNDDFESRGGFLGTPPRSDYGGAYVLIPYSGYSDYSKIQIFSDIIFNHRELSKLTIEVLNSTLLNGVAGRVAKRLERYGLNIGSVGNTTETSKYTQINVLTSNVDINSFTNYWDKIFPLSQVKIVDKIGYYEETDIDIEIIIGNNIKF